MVAPPICQKPLLEERGWGSIDPVKSESLAPPRCNSESVLASLKLKDSGETLPWENAVSKNGFCFKLDMAGKANPRTLQTIISRDNATVVNPYPSIGSLAKLDDNLVTGEKYWPEAWMPATMTAEVTMEGSTRDGITYPCQCIQDRTRLSHLHIR